MCGGQSRPAVESFLMTAPQVWAGWTLLAVADLPDGQADSELAVIVQVAIRFADRFAPPDRAYAGDRPWWHGQVREALTQLRTDGLISVDPAEPTDTGRARVALLLASSDAEAPAITEEPTDEALPLINAGVIAPRCAARQPENTLVSPLTRMRPSR